MVEKVASFCLVQGYTLCIFNIVLKYLFDQITTILNQQQMYAQGQIIQSCIKCNQSVK